MFLFCHTIIHNNLEKKLESRMELQLGFKITKTLDDFSSSTSDIQIAKDGAGSLFVSRETDSMFILTAHLKGFKRENIGIKINEDGNQISISGKKAIQEMEMKGWIMYKKQVEIREFNKTFLIPNGVILDKIEAKFNDDESLLTIFMPKLVKGIQGIKIEEIIEKEKPEKPVILAEIRRNKEMGQIDEESTKKPIEEFADRKIESESGSERLDGGIQESESMEQNEEDETAENGENERGNSVSKRCKMCNPLFIAGSALFASIVVLVIRLIRAKKR